MNEKFLFDAIRQSIFGGRLKQSQVDGIKRILAYRDAKWPRMNDAELAYVLATVAHETAQTMQPIRERGSQAYLRSKPYYPYYGRGLAQLTWKANYDKFGVKRPDDALEWPTALRVLFEGMIFGKFTGHKLADHIDANTVDFVNARRIINGTDRAALVAEIAHKFHSALFLASSTNQPEPKEETVLNLGPLAPILNAIVGNPLTSIPGALILLPNIGKALEQLGVALQHIGDGGLINWLQQPATVGAIGGLIGLFSKDYRVTGGTKKAFVDDPDAH